MYDNWSGFLFGTNETALGWLTRNSDRDVSSCHNGHELIMSAKDTADRRKPGGKSEYVVNRYIQRVQRVLYQSVMVHPQR